MAKAEIKFGELGGVKYNSGTLTISSTTYSGHIDVGFQPKQVVIYKVSGNPATNGSYSMMYNADDNPNEQIVANVYNGTNSIARMPLTTSGSGFYGVDSTGFTVTISSYFSGGWNWFAVG